MDENYIKQHIVHCKRESYDIYIGRGSKWGNPYSHKQGTQAKYVVSTVEEAIERYRKYLWRQIKSGQITLRQLSALDGKILGCWCAPKRCHGEVLIPAAAWAKQELNKEVK